MSEKGWRERQSQGNHRVPVVGRSSSTPFCAYYEDGATCQVTTGLREVLIIAGPPKLVLVACPAHYEAVRRRAEEFLLRCQVGPQTIVFGTQGERTSAVTVKGFPKKSFC